MLAALLLALPGRPRRVVAVLAGGLLGLVAVVKVGDLGFYSSLGRPFDLVLDWSLLDEAFTFVAESIGDRARSPSHSGSGWFCCPYRY